MTDCKVKSTPTNLGTCLISVNECEADIKSMSYQQAIGALMFPSIVMRPDMTYIINYLSKFVTCYDRQH